jgi:hypothetical protein
VIPEPLGVPKLFYDSQLMPPSLLSPSKAA